MYRITKEVYFCYGHRLMHHDGKCRHIHGHSVKAAITLESANLNEQSMVCDFGDLRTVVENYIDAELDHNFLIHKDDPLLPMLKEQGERHLCLDAHPTAEVISQMIYDHVKQKGLNVVEVVLWETASAFAAYREN
jgi:6-pyruvoyltetrahydropterin/6-carboxytetrahydropterin synthase